MPDCHDTHVLSLDMKQWKHSIVATFLKNHPWELIVQARAQKHIFPFQLSPWCQALPQCDILFGNETDAWAGDVVSLGRFGSRHRPHPPTKEARAYAEAVGWETSDVEFIATRLWLCSRWDHLRIDRCLMKGCSPSKLVAKWLQQGGK